MVVIDGTEYQGSGNVIESRLSVVILAEIDEAFQWNKKMTVSFDGVDYEVASMRSVGKFDEQIRVEWDCENEATRLEKELRAKEAELEETQEELAESSREINNIRDALAALGSGIPTLSKLLDFLAAVKEALHIGTSASDD